MSSNLCSVHHVRDQFEGGPAILVDFNRGASGCARSVLAKKYQLYHDDRAGETRIDMRAVGDWQEIPPLGLDPGSFQGHVRPANVGGDSYRDGGKVLEICQMTARKLAAGKEGGGGGGGEKPVGADKWLAAVVYEMKAQGVLVVEGRKRSQMEEDEDKGCCVVQ
ncbi:hypothetical protein PWT90_02359 [Aphanocladium album]|nr:hypothetical protein PWT90_02359 [Aphanocladium album]